MTASLENKEIEICSHTISYYYDNDMDMPESDIKHVKQMINEGYIEGELCCIPDNEENEVYGYWSIIKN